MGEKLIFFFYINIECIDRVIKVLIDGKIVIFVDGFLSVLLIFVFYFDFFILLEDYNVFWMYVIFLRILRLIVVLFLICVILLYVVVLNYYYEFILSDLFEILILLRV